MKNLKKEAFYISFRQFIKFVYLIKQIYAHNKNKFLWKLNLVNIHY